MIRKRMELLPNVFLTVISTDKFKTNCLSLNLLRPLSREEAAYNALLPDVLLRGCEMCPDMGAVSTWLDQRYGVGIQTSVRKKGEVQTVGFFLDYINERYALSGEHLTDEICQLLGSFLLRPVLEDGVFRRDYVEGEKVNLINAIETQINEKRTYASIRLRQEMFQGEAYGVSKYGEKEDVERITPEALYAHYQNILAHSRVEFIFTGQTEEKKLKDSLLKALSGLPRGEVDLTRTELGQMPQTVKERTETLNVAQGKLVMGFRTGMTAGDARYPALLMLNGVYGGSLGSKLFMNVREKLSLCYYASSGLDRFKGVMLVSSGVDTENYERAKSEILLQLDACKNGKISEEELESTRSYLISALKTGEDSPYQLDDFQLGQLVGGFSYTTEELVRQLEQISVPEIQAAAQSIVLDTVYFLKGAAE